MNGMHITVLSTVADDTETLLLGGLAPQRLQSPRARSNALSVISALPITMQRKIVSPPTPERRPGPGMLSSHDRACSRASASAFCHRTVAHPQRREYQSEA